jgi:hypothetical protein
MTFETPAYGFLIHAEAFSPVLMERTLCARFGVCLHAQDGQKAGQWKARLGLIDPVSITHGGGLLLSACSIRPSVRLFGGPRKLPVPGSPGRAFLFSRAVRDGSCHHLELSKKLKELVPAEADRPAWKLRVGDTLWAHPLIEGAGFDSEEFGGLCFGQNRPGLAAFVVAHGFNE